ncbi:MAG: hypothetical protein CVT92_12910 [Bacteroidetes bacterium HGW-Bacteroidetes-1]|jgi:hypothetical protein|nr:MAG: hypothetical protein CVT92_12910 [Bacteroidetes bacterium HGW-Bacteroidetes-1]
MFPNSTILGPLFWIVMGGLYTISFTGFYYWITDSIIKMNWWKWLLSILWFLGLNITIAGGFTLFGEKEIRAGFWFLSVFGGVFIVLGVGLWRLLTSR